MKKGIVFLIIIVTSCNCYSQFVYKLKADSVKITNDSCSAELIIENSSKNVGGFLFNNGNGRTIFKRGLIGINNNKYVIGTDTLDLSKMETSENLQTLTSRGYKTSNRIWSKSLILADTTITGVTANGLGSIAAGKTITGTVGADGIGATAHGNTDSGSIKATASGSLATGASGHAIGSILASGTGAWAGGQAGYTTQRTVPSTVTASGEGSFAHGTTYGGTIKATSYGSFANGFANGKYSGIMSTNYGAVALGFVQGLNTDSILAGGQGSFAGGYVSNTSANQIPAYITANQSGAFAYGSIANSGSSISATSTGSLALGVSVLRGTIISSGQASFAQGFAQKKGRIQATNHGAFAIGFASDSIADGTFSTIQASQWGAMARGYAGKAGFGNLGFIYSSGRGSYAGGYADAGTLNAYGDGSFINGMVAGVGGLIAAGNNASFVNAYVTGTDSAYNTGAASFLSGGKLYNTGNYSSLFGYGMRNTINNTFKVGWNYDQFTVDGSSNLITISSAVTFKATAEPPTPAEGTVVEWFDGNSKSKKVKFDDGSTKIIYTKGP